MAQDLPIYTDSVIRQMKFRKVVLSIGRDVLHACVLSCCTETIEEIAKKCGVGKLERKHPFGKKLVKERIVTEEKIKAREDPSGKSFDITFLSKILSLIEADYSSFYEKIKAVKDKRNYVCHNESPLNKDEYKKSLTNFETLINITLKGAEIVSQEQKLHVSCQTNIDQISEGIKQINELKSELKNKITKSKTETINESMEDLLEYIQTEGQKEIINSYDKLINMNPIDFFIGTKHKELVSEFYTELEFIDNKKKCPILQNDVVEMAESGSYNVIIEGNSGMGKTTLIRQIMAGKEDKTTSESLLIHFACRNDNVSSLEALLAQLMPKASEIFPGKKLTTAIRLLKPVFLVDGVDELNKNSRKILKEIIAEVKSNDATIFATSRHEGVNEFLSGIAGTKTKHLEIRGIPRANQRDIIEKYMNIFSPYFSTTSAPSLQEVIVKLDELSKSLGTYMRVPLIICLLVYLILSPEKIDSKSTLTEVYNAITGALLVKLKIRIINSADPLEGDLDSDSKVKKIFSYVCNESFRSLKKGEDTTFNMFDRIYEIFGRRREDVMSSFFVCKGSITHTGYEKTYSFPHKSFQEFFAARHIETILINDKRARFLELVDFNSRDHNLLHFTLGIMALKERLTSDICEAIVEKVTNPYLTHFHVVRYSKRNRLMLKAVSNNCTDLKFDQREDDIEDLQKILEEECPRMTTVELRFELQSNETSSSIVNIMSLLKKKNLEIWLSFKNASCGPTHYFCDAYIRALHGGRSRVTLFHGCLGEEGINLLPDHLEDLDLHIGSDISAEGLHHLGNDGKRSIEDLLLYIQSREFDARRLPKKFPIPNSSLYVHFHDEVKDGLPWSLEVMDRLPRRGRGKWTPDSKCNNIRIYLRGLKSEDEDAAIQFLEGLKGKSFEKMEICLGQLYSSLLRKYMRTLKSLQEEGILISD